MPSSRSANPEAPRHSFAITDLPLTKSEVSKAVADLILTDEKLRPWLVHQLFYVVRDYAHLRDFFAGLPTGGAVKKEIGKVLATAEAALDAMDNLSPSAKLCISTGMEPQFEAEAERLSYDEARCDLSSLVEKFRRASGKLQPKLTRRRPFYALDLVVGIMMWMLEHTTGNRAVARRGRSGISEPTLVSPEAVVIGTLLRWVDDRFSLTTTVHKIESIARLHRNQSLNMYAAALFAAPPEIALRVGLKHNLFGRQRAK